MSVSNGQFLSAVGDGSFIPGSIDNISGKVVATADSKTGLGPGPTGSGTLAIIEWLAIGAGSSTISIAPSGVILLDSHLNDIPSTTLPSAVTVFVPEPMPIGLILVGLLSLHVFTEGRVNKPATDAR